MKQLGPCLPCLQLTTVMIGMLSLVSNMGAVIVCSEMIRHGSRNRSISWDVAIIVSCSMQMTMALLLLLGVYKRSRLLLLPWLVVQLVLVLLCMAAIFIELHVIQLVYIGITLPLWLIVIVCYARLRKQSADRQPATSTC